MRRSSRAPPNMGWILLTSKTEYWNVVRAYSPPGCVTYFGKLINVFDNILLGANATQIAGLKDFFNAPTSTPNTNFAAELSFPYNLQSHSWLPCLNKKANPRFCKDLTASTVLFPKAKASEDKARMIIRDGGWANETKSLTTALLNFLGYAYGFKRGPLHEPLHERDDLKSSGLDLKLYAYQYQLCTEMGMFLTGDQPPYPLPVISSLVTLNYTLERCSGAPLNIPALPDTVRWNKYGGQNLSYPRLMLVAGEADPVRIAMSKTVTRATWSPPRRPRHLSCKYLIVFETSANLNAYRF